MRPLPPLLLDDRVGSGELEPRLKAARLPVELTRLEAGDIAFEGDGPDHAVVKIGVERKRIGDLLACLRDSRYSGEQLPGLKARFDVVVLVIEGAWREGEDGVLETWQRGGWRPWRHGGVRSAQEVRAFTLTQQFKAGVHIVLSWGAEQTAQWIAALYWWWNLGGGYESHKSHRGVYLPSETVDLLNLVGRMAYPLPHVGLTTAVYVQDRFKTPIEMVTAPFSAWAGISWKSKKGRRVSLGASAALDIKAALNGRER